MDEKELEAAITLFRKVVTIKAMTMIAFIDKNETIETTVKLPKYIVAAITECSSCWANKGRINDLFDVIIGAFIQDGIFLNYEKQIENKTKNIPDSCLNCMVSGKSIIKETIK